MTILICVLCCFCCVENMKEKFYQSVLSNVDMENICYNIHVEIFFDMNAFVQTAFRIDWT